MSLAHLNQESRNELERRVLAAALKQSLLKGDKKGAKLAHECLTVLLKVKKIDGQEAENLDANSDELAEVIETEQAADNNNGSDAPALQPLKDQERPPKSALKIDFELPPAEKAQMKAASAKSAKAVKPNDDSEKATQNVELTTTAENQTIYGSEGEQMLAGIILPPFLTEPQIGLQYHALYKMLGVRQTASRDDIHQTFLRLVRHILRELRGAKRPSRQELLGYLRKIWIAHDILTDPNTRTDYDFRDLGLRGTAETETVPDSNSSKPQSTQMLLRIGELLQCAGLLETAELDIACDMHKAMPEMMFGTFLVKQGYIADSELEAVLFGQKALRAGAISVAQFQVAMELAREQTLAVKDALIEKGFATRAQLDEIEQKQDASQPSVNGSRDATASKGPIAVANPETNLEPGTQGVQTAGTAPDLVTTDNDSASAGPRTAAKNEASTLESIEERLASVQPLQISKALPSWKDQLDWSSPEETSVAKAPHSDEAKAEVAPPVAPELQETSTAATPLEVAIPNETDLSEVTGNPEETKTPEKADTETVEALTESEQQEDVTSKSSDEKDCAQSKQETTEAEKEPGLFSHMREAASFYDAEEDFFTTYNYAQSESDVEKARSSEKESTEEVASPELETLEQSDQTESVNKSVADENLENSDDLVESENLKAEEEEEEQKKTETVSESATESDTTTETESQTEPEPETETGSDSGTKSSVSNSPATIEETETAGDKDVHVSDDTDTEPKTTKLDEDEGGDAKGMTRS